MIQPEKIKDFWDKRGQQYAKVPYESIANLEEDPALLSLKIDIEIKQVMPRLPLDKTFNVLDLGAGCGQWAFRLASHVNAIVAVEYSQPLVDIGMREAEHRGIKNVTFVASAAEEFRTTEHYDLILISGLFVYLTDEQVNKLMSKLTKWLKPGGTLFLRDGTSIQGTRHALQNIYSPVLKTHYSAIYRTAQEYIETFKNAGFQLTEEGQMFDEGCPLNKYPETRLRFYSFTI